jgi:hypothetical protein
MPQAVRLLFSFGPDLHPQTEQTLFRDTIMKLIQSQTLEYKKLIAQQAEPAA